MNDLSWDLGIGCIVLILYISGKLWIYYKSENKNK